MSNLVIITDRQPVTTSLIIAEGINNEHASVINLVRTYQQILEEFGNVDFKSTYVGETQKRATEYALLNEQQATFLITLMRNSGIVVQFKKELVKAFFAMRDRIRADKTVDVNMNHQRNFDAGVAEKIGRDLPNHIRLQLIQKCTGVDLSDIIEQVKPVEYAEVEDFINDVCRVENGAVTNSNELWKHYRAYASVVEKKLLLQNTFMYRMDELFFCTLRKGEPVYLGISITKKDI